jgi:predicted nuclease of predicted toxin-antitoxin system
VQIRYHLDESVNHAVAAGLRRRGIDVTTATEVGLLGVDDKDQLAFAQANSRVTVSHDSDFLRLAAAGQGHAGVAYCHQRDRTIGQIVTALVRLWRTRTAEETQGQVIFL